MLINKFKHTAVKFAYRVLPAALPRYKETDNLNLGISTLFYHNGVEMSIYSLSSLFNQIGFSLPIFGVSDGTLTPKDIKLLHRHFNVKLISPMQSEKKMTRLLQRYPDFKKYRLNSSSPYTKLKFDSIFLSPFSRLIFVEYDILFHSQPKEILNWISKKSNKFLCMVHDRNYLGSFKRDDLDYSFRSLLKLVGYDIISPCFNAGLLCIPQKNKISLIKLNKIFHFFNSLSYSNTTFAEETALGIVYQDINGTILPTKKYTCPVTFDEYQKAKTKKISALHYIGESKNFFERDAVKLILKERFFRK